MRSTNKKNVSREKKSSLKKDENKSPNSKKNHRQVKTKISEHQYFVKKNKKDFLEPSRESRTHRLSHQKKMATDEKTIFLLKNDLEDQFSFENRHEDFNAEQIEWQLIDVEMKDPFGKMIFFQKGVEAPIGWSKNAIHIVASRYFRNKKNFENENLKVNKERTDNPQKDLNVKSDSSSQKGLKNLRSRIPNGKDSNEKNIKEMRPFEKVSKENSVKELVFRVVHTLGQQLLNQLFQSEESHKNAEEMSRINSANKLINKNKFINKKNYILPLASGASSATRFSLSSSSSSFEFEGVRGNFEMMLSRYIFQQMGSFNSPVWFNLGLFPEYQLKSKQGAWAFDFQKRTVNFFENGFERPQVSACFILNVNDGLEEIFNFALLEAKIFKFGSGTGANFSRVMSKYEDLKGGGKASGLIPFLNFLDRGAGTIKSGGTLRRAAKMVCLDLNHPEIEEFVLWKMKEESKARALIEAGFSADYNGEAYRTVSGQNSNNSVRIPDRFFDDLDAGRDWPLVNQSGDIIKKIPARELWKKICEAAWYCADPGVQFNDHIQKWNTCSDSFEIRASNPCSEYMFLDNSACNLVSLNLKKYISKNSEFNWSDFLSAAEVFFVAQDLLVDYAGYPTKEIAENSHNFRPLGLGVCGLGSFLMSRGMAYDSHKGRFWAALLMALMQGQAVITSAKIAKRLGPFPKYLENKISVKRVLLEHKKNLKILVKQGDQAFKQGFFQENFGFEKINPEEIPELSRLLKMAQQIWTEAIQLVDRWGLRNAQLTALAPTGTIGLMMDCETTGIEPEYSLMKMKKMTEGSEVLWMSESLERGLESLGYPEEQILKINLYLQKNSHLSGSLLKEEHYRIFQTAQDSSDSRFQISPEGHLKMVAALQPFVSGAISKTINLSEGVTPEDIGFIYRRAWELEIKSVSIYRNGSKNSQPLNEIIRKSKSKSEIKSEIEKELEVESKRKGHALGEREVNGQSNMKIKMTHPEIYSEACPMCGHEMKIISRCVLCSYCGFSTGCSI